MWLDKALVKHQQLSTTELVDSGLGHDHLRNTRSIMGSCKEWRGLERKYEEMGRQQKIVYAETKPSCEMVIEVRIA